VLGAGHLKLADFERLLDRNPEIRQVELSNYGEMFLNPQLPDLLACAYERKVAVSGRNGANLNHTSEAALNAVVKYRLTALTCSIDGATQESYSRYRINGQLERVLATIDRIRDLRRSSGSAFPLLDWQFVVMGHNEHEIEAARAMAHARGMHFFPRLSWNADHSPIVNHDLVRIQTGLGAASRAEYREKKGVEYTRDICSQLWRAPVINWDGKMLGCCVNYWGDFGGNVFVDGLHSTMSHPKLEYAREMLKGNAEPRPDIPCTTCEQYRAIRHGQDWISDEEIRRPRGNEFLVGITINAHPAIKFARISVAKGSAGTLHFQPSGRLFRFGCDAALYFDSQAAGLYTVSVQCLGAEGWGRVISRTFEIAERPLCQQINIDLQRDEGIPETVGKPVSVEFWIR
jgi:hypothetical protein